MKRWNANTTATFLTRVGVLTPRPSPPHEPEGRAGCPQRAGNGAKPPSLLRRGESVSVQIVASRDDFAERGHPGRSVSPTRESRELTDVSAVGNRCAQDGRAPFRLRHCRAAPYRGIAFCSALATPNTLERGPALPIENRRYNFARLNTYGQPALPSGSWRG